MLNKPQKSLEETIREMRIRYKNVPSPLSETYNRSNSNVNFVPIKSTTDINKNRLLDGFIPNGIKFGSPL